MSETGRRRAILAAVIIAAMTLLLSNLGGTDLWAPDEPRYAEIAEEIRTNAHDPASWVLLRLNQEPYTQKPPLYFWLAALAGTAGDHVSEVAARLPSALAGVATVALTFVIGTLLFRNLPVGVWSALILLTSFLFAHLARRVQLDVLLTLFETLALWTFLRVERGIGSPRLNLGILYGALGCAVLIKGPVGLLPLAVIAGFLAWEGRVREFRRYVPAWGLCLAVGPALIWIATATALAPPGFFGEAVVENLFGRFFGGTSHARPIYYYAIQFPANFLPWTLLWPLVFFCAYRHLRRPGDTSGDPSAWRFLVAWLLVFLVFFSLSTGKRGLYLLPAFPATAILCGAALNEALSRRSQLPTWLRGVLSTGLVLLAAAGFFFLWNPAFEFAPGFAASRGFAIGLLLVAGVVGWISTRAVPRVNRASLHTGLVVTAVFALEWLFFCVVLPGFNDEKSPRPIAEKASKIGPHDTPIGVYQQRALVGGIVYYGSKAVVELPDPDSLQTFVTSGGGPILMRASHLDAAQTRVPLRVAASHRRGKRRILIAVAAPGAKQDAARNAAAEDAAQSGKPSK